MEKILELLEEYEAVSKNMSASHGDQRNWRILLAEAIYKQNAAEQPRAADEPTRCPACNELTVYGGECHSALCPSAHR